MKVGYARVSTLDQNPEMQIEALEAAGCEKIFVEKKSGAKKDRPELKAAVDYLRPGDALVVWKLSRLARGLDQLISTERDLRDRCIELISLTEQLDTSSPMGRAMFQFIGVLDELQREIIRENTIEGLASAKRAGRRPGRKPIDLPPEKMAMAETLLRSGGYSAREIADTLGIGRTKLYELFPGGRAGLGHDDSNGEDDG